MDGGTLRGKLFPGMISMQKEVNCKNGWKSLEREVGRERGSGELCSLFSHKVQLQKQNNNVMKNNWQKQALSQQSTPDTLEKNTTACD